MESQQNLDEKKRQLKLRAEFISGLKQLGFEQTILASGWPVYCKWAHSAEDFSAVKLHYEDQSGEGKQYTVFFHLPTNRVVGKIKMSNTNLIGSPPDWLRENLEFLCKLAKQDRTNRDSQAKIEAAFEKARPLLEKELDEESSKE